MTLPYDYMPAVLAAIDLISSGHTESTACDESNVGLNTFKNYIKNNPQLQDMYAEALQRGYDALADALLSPDNHHLYGQSDAKMAKVVSDNIKWFLERKDSKRYGQRVEINHHLSADKAITQALLAARNRVALPEPDDAIDASFSVVEQTEEEMLAEMGLA
jgi:hypothetical protein